ncbi:hypothetical protein MHBO_004829 [Bonamia ostreae]|uniref:DUS-like FMN-binding domain-containing protein n=1 Tax=Bonamia ostreae TaxID=126728 RepID=A0ABV2AUE3_9EUKA
MRLVRKTDQTTNLVNFLSPDKNHSIFTTFIGEPVVFQLGTADAVNALKAVKVVQRDIKAVDINMGCPFKFSVAGGMGAALLRKPEVVRDIVQTLKRNIDVPVTCKVRVLENVDESLELVRRIEKSGADVHLIN